MEVAIAVTNAGYGGYWGDYNLTIPYDKIISFFEVGATSNTPCSVSIVNNSGIRCLSVSGPLDFCTVRILYTD